MLFTLFLNLLIMAGVFCTTIGILTVFYWCKKPNKPADTSNRLNNISAWWIGLTRPEDLAEKYKYFRQDLMDNIEDVEELNNKNRQ